MNYLLNHFEALGIIGAILCLLCLMYSILCFLMPFFIITINSKIDSLDNQIKMLQKRSDDIAYILIHQVDAKTADKEFDNNMEE